MEYQHNIMRHTLLSNQDLLLTIDDKVATLIISALPRILHNLILAQLGKVTEARADHDWDFADGDLVLHENLCLRLNFVLASERVLISIMDLEDLDLAEDLRLIGQITDPCRVRHDRFVAAIAFVQPRELVDNSAAKSNFVRRFFVIVAEVLASLVNRLLLELVDDLLDRVEEEALEGEDLLRHQAVLLEVAVDHLPAIVLINRVVVDLLIPVVISDHGLLAPHFHSMTINNNIINFNINARY